MRAIENHLLCELSAPVMDAVIGKMRLAPLNAGTVLQTQGEAIRSCYFLESGLVSIVRVLVDGAALEASLVGREGMIGSPVTAEACPSCEQVQVLTDGQAYEITTERLHELAAEHDELRALLGRYAQLIIDEARMNAVCNAAHGFEQRLAKFLLRCHDRLDDDRLSLTQETVAEMLGVQRTTVTAALQRLAAENLIASGRGRIEIVNLKRLRRLACDCYRETTERFAAMRLPEPAAPVECALS